MKNIYSCLLMLLFLLASTKINAQLTSVQLQPSTKTSLPYKLPNIEDNRKNITSISIKQKQINAMSVIPSFNINPSSENCALLNVLQPSLKLNGERLNADLVNLKWQAKDSYNKKGFEVQRSVGDTNNFQSFTFVNAYTNQLAKEDYKLSDANSSIQPIYYRLKQVKTDSAFIYSNIILVKGILQCNLFPNPVKDVLFFRLQSIQSGNITVQVYDSKGSIVRTQLTGVTKNVINTGSINVKTLTAGTYNIKVSCSNAVLYTDAFIKE